MEEALRRKQYSLSKLWQALLSTYKEKEIKDLLGYLSFTITHNDDKSFRRIINLPKGEIWSNLGR